MRDLKATITIREQDAAKAIQQAEDMKSKLQDSFKEFISMDETMKVLERKLSKEVKLSSCETTCSKKIWLN